LSGLLSSIFSAFKFDPAVFPAVGLFSLKVAVFCVPFLLLGLCLERKVDGKARTDLPRRSLKAAVFLLFTLPILLLGLVNYVNTVRPTLLASLLEKHPDLENFMIIEGVWPSLLLVGLVTLFAILNLVEIDRGDTSR
jgi:hypothetical protein